MKLTKKQLKKIIKEELEVAMSEMAGPFKTYMHSQEPLQKQLIDGLRDMGLAANPSEQPQKIRIKGRDGQVVEFDISSYTMNDYNQALSDAFQKVVAQDTDLSMRRRASTRRMGQGMQSVKIDDPMMEKKSRQ